MEPNGTFHDSCGHVSRLPEGITNVDGTRTCPCKARYACIPDRNRDHVVLVRIDDEDDDDDGIILLVDDDGPPPPPILAVVMIVMRVSSRSSSLDLAVADKTKTLPDDDDEGAIHENAAATVANVVEVFATTTTTTARRFRMAPCYLFFLLFSSSFGEINTSLICDGRHFKRTSYKLYLLTKQSYHTVGT